MLGGYVFGFGSYMSCHMTNHLNFALIFPIPLLVLIWVRYIKASISGRRFVGYAALLLAVLFFTSVELVFVVTLFGFVGVGIAWCFRDAELRARLRSGVALAAVAYGVLLVVTAPYLWIMFSQPDPLDGVVGANGPTDLANILVGTDVTAFPLLRGSLATNVTEQAAYLGPVALLVLLWGGWLLRRSRIAVYCLVFAGVALLLSLGANLTVAGTQTVPLPWRLVTDLPIAKHAITARFVVVVWIALAVLVALLAERCRGNRRTLLAFGLVLTLLPAVNSAAWTSKLDIPPLFERDGWKQVLHVNDNVLMAPIGILGDSMLWQQRTDFKLRLAGGYFAPNVPEPFEDDPIAKAIYTAQPMPHDAVLRLPTLVSTRSIDAILIRDGFNRDFAAVATRVYGPGRHLGGVTVWRTHP